MVTELTSLELENSVVMVKYDLQESIVKGSDSIFNLQPSTFNLIEGTPMLQQCLVKDSDSIYTDLKEETSLSLV